MIGKSGKLQMMPETTLKSGSGMRQKDKNLQLYSISTKPSLSNWEVMDDCGFCSYPSQLKLYPDVQGSAIIRFLNCSTTARKMGVAVFFVTGRQNAQGEATIKPDCVGYSGWADLVMQPWIKSRLLVG
jgi:hypothetical protein